MESIPYKPIGVLRSSFKFLEQMPIQPSGGFGGSGRVKVNPVYEQRLKDLDGFSHMMLVYHLHRAVGFSLRVIPFLDDAPSFRRCTQRPFFHKGAGPSLIGLPNVILRSI